jgi:hypothetical protein
VSPALTKASYARYPLIFRNWNLPALRGLPFGFELFSGDACEGWVLILGRLFVRLETKCHRLLSEGVAEDVLISITEVCQKSGVLRIRLTPRGAKRDTEILAAVNEAVEASIKTSLFCGAVGVLRKDTGHYGCNACEAQRAKLGRF